MNLLVLVALAASAGQELGAVAISRSQIVVSATVSKGRGIVFERALRRLPLHWERAGEVRPNQVRYGFAVYTDHDLAANTAYMYRSVGPTGPSEPVYAGTISWGPRFVGPKENGLETTNLTLDRDTGIWYPYPMEGMPAFKAPGPTGAPAGRIADLEARNAAVTELRGHPVRIRFDFSGGRQTEIKNRAEVRRVLRAFLQASRLKRIQDEPLGVLAEKDFIWVYDDHVPAATASFALERDRVADEWGPEALGVYRRYTQMRR